MPQARWWESLTAGAPLLHLTGQGESTDLDKDLSYIHEARDQRLPAALRKAQSANGPFILEIDMQAIGSFKSIFAGPPPKLAWPA